MTPVIETYAKKTGCTVAPLIDAVEDVGFVVGIAEAVVGAGMSSLKDVVCQ